MYISVGKKFILLFQVLFFPLEIEYAFIKWKIPFNLQRLKHFVIRL